MVHCGRPLIMFFTPQLTAENEQLKESLKRVTFEKEQIEATYCNGSQYKYHRDQPSSLGEYSSVFDKQTGELMEKARLHLVKEEVDRQVAEKMKELQTHAEPMKSVTRELSMDSAEYGMDDQINLPIGKCCVYCNLNYVYLPAVNQVLPTGWCNLYKFWSDVIYCGKFLSWVTFQTVP